ncbi:MAG TPA: serine protease, partial [Ktedonobacteraceae bacterium]|nr:serine protease [Ktedonobacteraceae bacterium]
MYSPTNKHAYKKPYILVVMGIVCAFVYAFFLKSGTAYAGGTPPGGNITDPGVRAVDIAAPAVVRIITTINGHLTVHFSSTSNITFPQSSSASYAVQVSGTGTFITSKGDILTADHVVNPPKDQTLNQYLFTLAAQDVADYMNQNGKGQVTKDQVLQQLSGGQLQSTTSFDTPSSEALLSTSYTGPLTAPDFNSLPTQIYAKVDQIEKESSPDQKDLAVVHVPMTDTPSVQLGDSSNVQVQDTLTIIGFPGNADVSQKPTDFLTSSINKINVSSIKTTSSGAPVIQVGGNVEHGDSGGPALDTNGTVVGI